ncbi:rhodanese-like domain-containing protein [Desulfobacterales bacterium HSG2]|nr:rhodanese-like domain-containing protein [Desulfobacterales bacterium HSG2]
MNRFTDIMSYKNMTKELVILLGIAIVIGFTANYFSPKGIALFGEWDTSKGVITAKSKEDVVVRELEITDVPVAKKMYDTGKYLFLDARSYEVYEEGRIKGAVSVPVGGFYDVADTFIEKYPLSTGIITYCSGRECDDSHELAQYLFDEGYTEIHVFIDGYPAWKAEGYPIE